MNPTTVLANTLTDQVYHSLKRQILSRRLAPGARLVAGHLAASMGVSLTPVREALRLLEKDALIESVPHRGAVVVRPTRKIFEDLFAVRRRLEGLAARLAALGADAAAVAAIAETIEATEAAVDRDDEQAFVEADRGFHRAVAAACGNEVLAPLIASLADRLRLFHTMTLGSHEGPRRTLGQHAAVFEAIRRGDAEEAEQCMLDHIDFSLANAIERGCI